MLADGFCFNSEIPFGESADTDFKISPVCFFRL